LQEPIALFYFMENIHFLYGKLLFGVSVLDIRIYKKTENC